MSLFRSSVQRRCVQHLTRGQSMLRSRAPYGQVDERLFGPQVPGENPVHWIAERAPPRCS